MKISILPAENENTPSSRIRAYSLYKHLYEKGFNIYLGLSEQSDVIFIQKKITLEIIQAAAHYKELGTKIIYDVDDLGCALDYYAPGSLFQSMVEIADIITTDTEGHQDHIKSAYPEADVVIIPDTIDYYPNGPVVLPVRTANPLKILWFGCISNIGLFEKYASALTALENVEVVVATAASELEAYKTIYPMIQFVPWSRETFIETLQSCHLSCLMHDGAEVDRSKSNNKMIASLTWGVPAVCSRTPEYEKTALLAGIEDCLFSDVHELAAVVERYRSASSRSEYLSKSQSIIWANYSIQAISMQFIFLLRDLLAKDTITARSSQPHAPTPLQSDNPRERDYHKVWVAPEGKAYRIGIYERQSRGGYKPLIDNPSFDEVRSSLRAYNPKAVLELGCGWGRILEELVDEFNIQGCDVSDDMLCLCRQDLSVFKYDITCEKIPFLRAHRRRWDIIFTRDVMLYIMENPLQMAYAINSLLMLAPQKIIIWEQPEVCDRIRQFSSSPKFEYRPIERRSE